MNIDTNQNNTIFANQMIKKGFNILIVILTGMLLLAHAIVPHHHHNLQVCVVDIHSGHKDATHDHSCNNENHQHDHEADDLSCILEKIVMFRPGQSEQDGKFILSLDDEANYFFVTIFSNPETNQFYSGELNNSSPPDLEKTYANQAPKTFGLRAPPTV